MQEREPAHGLAFPLRRWDEGDLIAVQATSPLLVVVGLPAEPSEQHDAEVGVADQFEMGLLTDQCRGRLG